MDAESTDATAESEPLRLYREAEAAVYSLISGPVTPAPGTTRAEIRRRATERLNRLRAFLEYIGNPHQQYRSIHVAGTSGKGSTSTYIASILQAAGYHTALHVSPYLQVATEKLIIDGQIASAKRYHQLVFELMEQAKAWADRGHPMPTYGEFWVALTFAYFAHEAVDYAVVEVGAGGRFDLTNVIEPEVAAITSVGLDHLVTLGPEITDIAWHKAGILKRGAAGVTTVVEPDTHAVIEQEARDQNVDLVTIRPDVNYRNVRTDWDGTTFHDAQSNREFHVRLPGDFQAANGALAMAAVRALPDGSIDDDAIATGLQQARFPGRMEIVQEQPLVLLDGAHNPQKMEGLVANLEGLLDGHRTILVLGVLESKSYVEMVDMLADHADCLIATSPQVFAKPPVQAAAIADAAAGKFAEIEAHPGPLEALERALAIAEPGDVVIVTGSLYLVGNVREHWYPTADILDQSTMWPKHS